MIKKIKYFFLFLIALSCLTGCSSSNEKLSDEDEQTLQILQQMETVNRITRDIVFYQSNQ